MLKYGEKLRAILFLSENDASGNEKIEIDASCSPTLHDNRVENSCVRKRMVTMVVGLLVVTSGSTDLPEQIAKMNLATTMSVDMCSEHLMRK